MRLEDRPADTERCTGPGEKSKEGTPRRGSIEGIVRDSDGRVRQRRGRSVCVKVAGRFWKRGVVVVVPGVVPQWTANAKYSRNCTASVRYKCSPGPALMRERKENEALDFLDEMVINSPILVASAGSGIWALSFLGGPEMGHWGIPSVQKCILEDQ